MHEVDLQAVQDSVISETRFLLHPRSSDCSLHILLISIDEAQMSVSNSEPLAPPTKSSRKNRPKWMDLDAIPRFFCPGGLCRWPTYAIVVPPPNVKLGCQ